MLNAELEQALYTLLQAPFFKPKIIHTAIEKWTINQICKYLFEKSNTPFSYMLCIGELNLERALDEDTGPGIFSFFSTVSENSTLHQ